jgi:pyruvate dehydrogenase E1 component alpha subunit
MSRQNKIGKKELIEFEQEIADLYTKGNIHAPIHLGGDNENQLIEIFKDIHPTDWIFSTWRNHYHWLLSGRDPEDLYQQIIHGGSMHVFGSRFFTSAIVGGVAPIAVGVAYAIKSKNLPERVWCFLGDMGASTGIAMESIRYACGHELPITFVIEDNHLSVKTDTKEAWGCKRCQILPQHYCYYYANEKVRYYEYNRKYPHAGTGVFVLF